MTAFWIRRLLCALGYHRVFVAQHFGSHHRRVQCERCWADWAMCDKLQALAEWGEDFEWAYREDGFEVWPGKVTWEV